MTNIAAQRDKLIIRDLPGIADLEVDLMMRRRDYEGIEEDMAASHGLKLFGIRAENLNDIYAQHEDDDDLLTAWQMPDDETMEKMLSIGVDFSNERGHPLRCTNLLAGYAEMAVKGIAGHLPDEGQLQLDRITSKLEQDRQAFLARKRR